MGSKTGFHPAMAGVPEQGHITTEDLRWSDKKVRGLGSWEGPVAQRSSYKITGQTRGSRTGHRMRTYIAWGVDGGCGCDR